MAGKATFFEELNEISDFPKDVCGKEKELFTRLGKALRKFQQDGPDGTLIKIQKTKQDHPQS